MSTLAVGLLRPSFAVADLTDEEKEVLRADRLLGAWCRIAIRPRGSVGGSRKIVTLTLPEPSPILAPRIFKRTHVNTPSSTADLRAPVARVLVSASISIISLPTTIGISTSIGSG